MPYPNHTPHCSCFRKVQSYILKSRIINSIMSGNDVIIPTEVLLVECEKLELSVEHFPDLPVFRRAHLLRAPNLACTSRFSDLLAMSPVRKSGRGGVKLCLWRHPGRNDTRREIHNNLATVSALNSMNGVHKVIPAWHGKVSAHVFPVLKLRPLHRILHLRFCVSSRPSTKDGRPPSQPGRVKKRF